VWSGFRTNCATKQKARNPKSVERFSDKLRDQTKGAQSKSVERFSDKLRGQTKDWSMIALQRSGIML
jgi:hypothetical protein